jgi:hypothetical protein
MADPTRTDTRKRAEGVSIEQYRSVPRRYGPQGLGSDLTVCEQTARHPTPMDARSWYSPDPDGDAGSAVDGGRQRTFVPPDTVDRNGPVSEPTRGEP